jgi:hypothetical protein
MTVARVALRQTLKAYKHVERPGIAPGSHAVIPWRV